MEAYGVGTRCLKLLRNYWANQQCVARQSNYHGTAFQPSRGVTQGGVISCTVFNICVDAVVRHWLEICSEQPDIEARAGFEHRIGVALRHILTYVDDTSLGSDDPVWLQNSIQYLCECFARVGLATNTDKTEAMTCIPGSLRTHHSEAGYKRRLEGHGDDYRARKRQRMSCPECALDLAIGSLPSHLRSQHGIEAVGNTGVAFMVEIPRRYTVTYPPPVVLHCACPVEGCIYQSPNANRLRQHFASRHPRDELVITGDGSTQCGACGRMVTLYGWRRGHATSRTCAIAAQTRRQREAVQACQLAREQTFTINGDELRSVETFKYLGRIVSSTDSDWPALKKNLTKARQRWAMISRVLVRDGADARISGMFYKAAVLTILLYGSETWVWTLRMYKAAQSFHNSAARRISRLVARRQNGVWVWPPLADALKACHMHPLSVYIHRRREQIQPYLDTRATFNLCTSTERLPGTPTGLTFLWEQRELPDQNGLEEVE